MRPLSVAGSYAGPRPLTLGIGCLLAVLLFALTPAAQAQYFGRNKVRYDNFDFKILETEHFDIYYYEGVEQASRDVARMAERWYDRLSAILGHEFDERKSIILYADDADFRQTNITNIGEGTQGVTEGLRQRVVLPVAGSYAETDHVLGHELVHQFQYDMAQSSGRFAQFVRMPLFLIEGLAEYLSVGREDALTSMWMRDAILRDDFPTISQLQRSGGYNEYQYGQPFWAYIGGTYGDEAAIRLFRTAMEMPIDSAIVTVTGLDPDDLSNRWREALRDQLVPGSAGRTVPQPPRTAEQLAEIAQNRDRRRQDRQEGKQARRPRFLAYPDSFAVMQGTRLLAKERETGTINIAPQLSPDGKYVAYLSEKDLFGIDLFLANAETGEVVAKLEEVGTDPHTDALRFIASAGTWSPDGTQFAYVVFAGGDNEIAILDVSRREVARRIKVADLGAIKDPSWSPDGSQLAFAGVKGGQTDLYLVDVTGPSSGQVRQLTNDRFADIQPAWRPDGSSIAFTTDRGPGTSFDRLTFAPMRLGLYDIASGEIEVLSLFPGAKHINPAWSPDGQSLYFISDNGGFKDVYRRDMETAALYQVTNLATGVSGIANHSPALSVSRGTGALAYSVFEGQRYSVYRLAEEEAGGTPVTEVLFAEGADILPPADAQARSKVTGYLADARSGLPSTSEFPERDYRSRLSLDYVSQPQIGATYNSPYTGGGLGAQGGIFMLFSDQLSDNRLGLTLQANGTFKDIGGQAVYLNQTRRLNYGAAVGHIPYLQPFLGPAPEGYLTRYYRRTYVSQASLISAYPLNRSQRFELDGGYTRYGYDLEYDSFLFEDGFVQYEGRRSAPDEIAQALRLQTEPLHLGQAGAAFIGDYSYFGFASPINGSRYRFGVDGTVGTLNFATVTADYRTYIMARTGILPDRAPITLAARALHYGRYLGDADENRLYPLYLGYGSLVRGYSFNSFGDLANGASAFDAFENRLFGSRMGVGSVEVRIPLLGTPQFGLVSFPYLPTELTFFGDAGVTWGLATRDLQGEPTTTSISDAQPIFSAGVSTRVNLLGALVLEPYYALPFSRYGEDGDLANGRGVFGLNLTPGW
ncbi:MAG: peptidase S9 [Bacteroidota bacterium]